MYAKHTHANLLQCFLLNNGIRFKIFYTYFKDYSLSSEALIILHVIPVEYLTLSPYFHVQGPTTTIPSLLVTNNGACYTDMVTNGTDKHVGYVLNTSTCPTIFVECGSICNVLNLEHKMHK